MTFVGGECREANKQGEGKENMVVNINMLQKRVENDSGEEEDETLTNR